MNKLKIILGIVTLAMVSGVAQAQYIQLLGGEFNFSGSSSGLVLPINQPLISSGSGLIHQGDVNSDTFLDFVLFAQPVSTYYKTSGPVINTDGFSDLSGFTGFWNGYEFNQGSSTVLSTDNGDGTFTLEWSKLVESGPFLGITGIWSMDIRPVPVPAAIWLLGSALIGLTAFNRNKSKKG